ncbi:9955_t:CDS:2, partial [Funneliformis caledonium]
MRFNELFTRHRKTEPSSVILLRILIMIILISSLTGYLTILIIDVTSDEPVLINTVIEATEIPIPGGSKEDNNYSCDEYIEQPKASLRNNKYTGYFKNVQNLTYVKPEIDGNAILGVSVLATIADTNYNATKGQDLMTFTATDSEFSPMRYQGEFNIDKSPAYIKELTAGNVYFMVRNQLARIQFTKNIRDTIIPKFKDHLGFEPTYYRQGYIMSNIRHELMFGLVGGAWGLAAALYAALFGVDLIRPWGCVQFYCYGIRKRAHNKLKKTLPIIPLVNSTPPPSSRDAFRDEHAALQLRVDALEVFLREYVVD